MAISVKGESKLLARHSLVYGLGNLLSKVTGFLMIPVYTRFLSPSDYGTLELLTLTSEVISIIITGRISSGIARFYFQYEGEREREEVISTSIVTVAVASGIGLILAAAFRDKLSQVVLGDPAFGYFFLVSFLGLWVSLVSEVGFLYLRIIKASEKYVVWSTTKLVLSLSLNIYFIVGLHIGVIGILYSQVAASGLILVGVVLPLLARIGVRFSSSILAEMAKFTLPLVPSSLANMIVLVADRFLLRSLVSLSETGIYSLANRFAAIPGYFISAPFMQIWTVRRMEVYKEQNAEEVMGRVFTYFCALMAAVGLGVAVLARDAIQIMANQEFWSAWKVVPILVLAQVVLSFFQHLNIGILIAKKTKYFLYIDSLNAVFSLGLYYYLIPKYGVYGAAIGSLVSYALRVVLVYIATIHFYRIHLEFNRISKLAISVFLLYFASSIVTTQLVWLSLLLKGLLVFAFPVLLWFLGFFRKSEIGLLRNALLKLRPA